MIPLALDHIDTSSYRSAWAEHAEHDPDSFATDYTGPIIPPIKTWRTIVLLFDGTGEEFDMNNSNIVTLASLLKKGDSDQQLVYYQTGIGTCTVSQSTDPIRAGVVKAWDLMFASSLGYHVKSGYEFLMNNYRKGDKICVFGFSRGAYTARALCGMIQKVGLLPRSNRQQVPFAYKMYTQDDAQGWKQSILFKKTFSIDVDIDFAGIWDTVHSIGLIPVALPFTRCNTSIKVFRHALALDERRVKFAPCLYQYPAPDCGEVIGILGDEVRDLKAKDETIGKEALQNLIQHELDDRKKHILEDMYLNRTKPTDVKEVWFAGCHCDVGGGSVANGTPHSQARISLRWMIRECFRTNTGIQFQAAKLRQIGLDPDSLFPEVKERPDLPDLVKPKSTGIRELVGHSDSRPHMKHTEEGHDTLDVLSPIYDELEVHKLWWVLECLPMTNYTQRSWGIERGFGLPRMGAHRTVPASLQERHGILVHRSVKTRMAHQGMKYTPRLKFEVEPTWVD